MSSLASLLPAPRAQPPPTLINPARDVPTTPVFQPPPYGQRRQLGWVPRKPEEYGDGGAFPEIHTPQFPLNMGRPNQASSTSIVPLSVDKDGKVTYDGIVKQGANKKKTIYSGFDAIVEKRVAKSELAKPTVDEEEETAKKTREALQKLIEGKIKAAKPVQVANQQGPEPTYVKYTPNPNAPGYNPNAKQRVIRVVEAQSDPMEPPKFKHKKVARGPPSPPVPVLHSPPRKVTVKEQQDWKIPPCISNWKNAKGYTIPLDKRLAADGRGLQGVTINDKFATLSEALYIGERKARDEVKIRNEIQKKLAMKEKEEEEAKLRELAARTRMERAGIRATSPESERHREELDDDSPSPRRGGSIDRETREEAMEREKLRRDRKREREREMRLEKLGKKGKLARDAERDVSERIALGQHVGTGKLEGEAIFDARLFNQSQGISAGFGQEDDYTVYSKPLFDRGEKQAVYRPKASEGDVYGNADAEYEKLAKTEKFRPDKEFRGVDRDSGQKRDGPVQFERDEDPFGIDQFLSEAKKGRTAMDNIGGGGTMKASAGSSSRDHYEGGSHRRFAGTSRDNPEFFGETSEYAGLIGNWRNHGQATK